MDKEVKIKIIRSDEKEFLIDGTDWRILSDGLEGFGTFENEISTVDNAIGNGGIITSARLGVKDRTITAKSRNPYINDILRKEAMSFFNPTFTYKIYLTYMGITRWCEAMVYRYSLPTENVNKIMTLKVTFLSADPFMRSYDDFGKDIASVSGCGFPYICAVAGQGMPTTAPSGIFNFAQKVVLENDGDVETYCRTVFKANGAVTDPVLYIGDGNNIYVKVNTTMRTGDVIEMDFAANPPTVKKNGSNFVGHCDRASSFDEMVLKVGETVVHFGATSGSNDLQVSLYYNKLYASI